jgi:hypothetical protein
MIPPDLAQFLINGGGHAVLAIGVIILWNKSERIEKSMLRAATRLGKIEADLENCNDDHLKALELIRQRDTRINELQAAADQRNRFGKH